jgi:hypothetical protein
MRPAPRWGPTRGLVVVEAHGDEPLIADVHVDLGEAPLNATTYAWSRSVASWGVRRRRRASSNVRSPSPNCSSSDSSSSLVGSTTSIQVWSPNSCCVIITVIVRRGGTRARASSAGCRHYAGTTMGQQIGVVEKSSSNPGVVRFEANRNLTGMGHEVFHYRRRRHRPAPGGDAGPQPAGHRPGRPRCTCTATSSPSIWRRASTAKASATSCAICTSTGSRAWRCPRSTTSPRCRCGSGCRRCCRGATGPEAAYLALVPAILVERSRAALAKWKAVALRIRLSLLLRYAVPGSPAVRLRR